MDKRLRILVNEIINDNYLAMFKFKDGYVYWIRKHWKYLSKDLPDAPCVRLGRSEPPHGLHYYKDGAIKYLYRTEPI